MTKREYVAEMLQETLTDYNLKQEDIDLCAANIVQGLDMWHEMSGDSVASSNRYGELSSQIERLKKDKETALDQAGRKHYEELEELKRYSRGVIYQKNQKIEELEKEINK